MALMDGFGRRVNAGSTGYPCCFSSFIYASRCVRSSSLISCSGKAGMAPNPWRTCARMRKAGKSLLFKAGPSPASPPGWHCWQFFIKTFCPCLISGTVMVMGPARGSPLRGELHPVASHGKTISVVNTRLRCHIRNRIGYDDFLVIRHSTPVPLRGSAATWAEAHGCRTLPPCPSVMTPKSTM